MTQDQLTKSGRDNKESHRHEWDKKKIKCVLCGEFKLAFENMGLVGDMVKKYAKFKQFGIDPQDLFQEGRMALLRCVEGGYDSSKGEFSTYACFSIKNGIIRFIGANLFSYYIPSYVGEAMLNRPTKESGVRMAKELRGRRHTSLDELIQESEDDNFSALFGQEDKNLEKVDHQQEIRERLKKLPREKQEILIRLSMGSTMVEIGKELGLTRQRVQQIKMEAIRMARKLPIN